MNTASSARLNGGDLVAEVLVRQGVRSLFTLCGGHISPILVGAKRRGIEIVDVRDEKNAAFAADATSRLTGVPGVAAVTAGPGVTNTLTALQNAMLAQVPLVLLGGAAATVLRGRGSLQDIDQMTAIRPFVKWAGAVTRVADLVPTVEQAFREAQSGVPGPVFVECPIDLLYDESLIREWYISSSGKGPKGLTQKAMNLYLERHLAKVFADLDKVRYATAAHADFTEPRWPLVEAAARMVAGADRPVLVVGSQALSRPQEADLVAAAVEKLGIPTFLAGMARGLLGKESELQLRHKRRNALKEADLVILAGVPCDFRMDYGRVIGGKAKIIGVNLELSTLMKNRLPTLPVPAEPGRFLQALAENKAAVGRSWPVWHGKLKERDAARDAEIEVMATEVCPPMNPVRVVQALEAALEDDAILVADGGDFVATAAYVVRPRKPLTWLDPGVFGTLGVGGGFALAAATARPESTVWLIYGDGAAGFSLVEFDTFARLGKGCIAVVGNDAGWTQIARDQIEILEDDVGTVLAPTAYDKVAEGLGGVGFAVSDIDALPAVLEQAKKLAKEGKAVLINCHIGKSEFRKGSISM